jgi:outer membrane protein, multidrug efflux system
MLLIAMVGCAAVGPDYKAPVIDAPDEWQNAVINEVNADNSPLDQWWSIFNDPVLDSLLERAKNANHDLRIALARISEAQAFNRIAGGDRYPDINVDGGFERTKTTLPVLGDNPSSFWSAGLATSWEVDVFGRVRRSIEASEAEIDVSIEDYRDVMVSLYAQVAINYVNVRTIQQRLKYAHDNVGSQRETLELVEFRLEAGLVPPYDVAQAKYNLANTETLIPELIPALENSLNQLAILLGQIPGSLDQELSEDSGLPLIETELAIAPPAELLRRRPDIRQAERQLAAQTALIGVATADLYPQFSLTGALTLGASEFGDLDNKIGWSFSPGVRWNIFSGGKVQGLIDVEESRTKQAAINYEKTVLDALAEVETTMVAMRQEGLRAEKFSEAVDASQESVELVTSGYKAGLSDFQSLLDSQRSLSVQQDKFVESKGLVIINFINLNRAMGGGWSIEDPIVAEKDDDSLSLKTKEGN